MFRQTVHLSAWNGMGHVAEPALLSHFDQGGADETKRSPCQTAAGCNPRHPQVLQFHERRAMGIHEDIQRPRDFADKPRNQT